MQTDVDRLAAFIIENIPGEPSQNEGAVDTAIRLLVTLMAVRRELNEARLKTEQVDRVLSEKLQMGSR